MKPEIIAYSKGFTVIPFENVLALTEDPTVDGQLVVTLNCSGHSRLPTVTIPRQDAQDFVDKYLIYLKTVEGITMTARFVPDEDGGDK